MTRQLLICAGLDPSGGAGLLADARVAALHDVRAVGVVTAQTVQDTKGVRSVAPVDGELLREQLEVLLSDIEVHAVKIGLLGAPPVAKALGEALALTAAPVVWDPVLAASRGGPMFEGALDEVLRALSPHLRLVTPNRHELAVLARRPVETLDDAVAAGEALGAALGAAVLVKGGHFEGDEAVDVLVDGALRERIVAPRVAGGSDVHGTGCALATAIAARLAGGAPLVDACREAAGFVRARIAAPQRPGRGAASVV